MDQTGRLDEAAIEEQRIERFRALPPRVRPDDVIGMVETRRAGGRPGSAPSEAQQAAFYGGG